MSAFETDPLGWTEEWDETYQCYFFFHAATGESSWERPVGLPESEDAKQLALEKASLQQEENIIQIPTEITNDVAEEAANWTVAWDDNYNSEFYYNTVTGETAWEKPSCLLALQSHDEVKVDEAASLDPANWSCEWDASYGCDFYYNSVTQESSWERPVCLGEKKEEESEEKTEVNETEGTVEDVIESVSKIEVTTSVATASKRRNSVMRRPSARPDLLIIKKASAANVPLPTPLPEITETETKTETETETKTETETETKTETETETKTETETETKTETETETKTETAVETPTIIKPKRRQSMAPRPAALPPKPLFVPVGNEGVILEGEDEDDDDDDAKNTTDSPIRSPATRTMKHTTHSNLNVFSCPM